MSYRSFRNSLPANEVNSIMLPARTMFQASKSLAKLTDFVARTDCYKCCCWTLYSEAYGGVFAVRTTFHKQTVIIDTFCVKANAWR